MRQIVELTNSANQDMSLLGENGEVIAFKLEYKPTQGFWYFDLSYNGKTINGARLVISPNILDSYKNIFSFGIACTSNDGGDPYFVDDFVNDRVQLYLLTEEERDEQDERLYG